jgi:predicted CopG family antitoxin
MATTTIQLDDRTLKQLATLKQQLKARSYQEVIQTLLTQRQKLPSSLFGSTKGSRPYKHTRETEHDL